MTRSGVRSSLAPPTFKAPLRRGFLFQALFRSRTLMRIVLAQTLMRRLSYCSDLCGTYGFERKWTSSRPRRSWATTRRAQGSPSGDLGHAGARFAASGAPTEHRLGSSPGRTESVVRWGLSNTFHSIRHGMSPARSWPSTSRWVYSGRPLRPMGQDRTEAGCRRPTAHRTSFCRLVADDAEGYQRQGD
jgi:hypothetical protein